MIYKYPLNITDEQTVLMPKEATILCVQMQHGIPCLWAEVDLEQEGDRRTIYTFGMGNPISIPAVERDYVGTYQMSNGGLIWHVFARH